MALMKTPPSKVGGASSSPSQTTREQDAPATLTPKLRFPEFREAAGWVEKTIGSVCKTFSGGTPSTLQKEFYGGNIPFIRSAEIDRDGTELYLTNEGLKNSAAKPVLKGDVLVALYGANSGEVALAKLNGAINQAILCLRSATSNTFIYQALSFKKDWIVSTYIQGGQGNLSGEIVKSIFLCFPLQEEQQKITDCLSSVDELIATQTQKLNALKTHKTGLMQQLFPAEGESVPKLRFSEFREEWKENGLKNLVIKSFYGTSSPTSDMGKYPVLRMANMSEGKISFSGLAYIDLSDNEFKKFMLKKGDILLNRTNSYDLVGKISIFDSEIECIFASYIIAYRLKTNIINPYFCNYILNTSLYQGKIRNIATKSVSQANINPTTFQETIAFFLPKIKEQQKIAACLSSIDELIAAQTQKHEALKTHKKALMQQLFPTPEEVEA
jgi:type I restriction enzyme S subunit